MAATLGSLIARDIVGAETAVKRLTAARVRRTAERILKKSPLAAFATIAPGGLAHVNTAYFAYSKKFEIFFLSHPESVHCRNLRTRPSMAVAVFESKQTWGALDRGLQLFGTCREARGAFARRARNAYAARFTAYAAWMDELAADRVEHDYQFYRFVPARIKVFDEREFAGAVFVTATMRA